MKRLDLDEILNREHGKLTNKIMKCRIVLVINKLSL